MASLLTATSFQGRLYYLGLLLLFSFLAVYLVFIKKPDVRYELERRAFQLNYAAFKNSIRLFNYRYLLQSAKSGNEAIEIEGLNFNSQGFPIGVQPIDKLAEFPASGENCRQIWRKVLGPLQPAVSITRTPDSYWVELSTDNHCIFHAGRVDDQIIDYDTVKGLVSLVVINR